MSETAPTQTEVCRWLRDHPGSHTRRDIARGLRPESPELACRMLPMRRLCLAGKIRAAGSIWCQDSSCHPTLTLYEITDAGLAFAALPARVQTSVSPREADPISRPEWLRRGQRESIETHLAAHHEELIAALERVMAGKGWMLLATIAREMGVGVTTVGRIMGYAATLGVCETRRIRGAAYWRLV